MKDGRPFCCNCFESLYAEYCETCGEHIGKYVLYNLQIKGKPIYGKKKITFQKCEFCK